MDAIHIMKPGTHVSSGGGKVSYSNADLAACAAVYNPARHEAPIVVGHPQTDAPAFGWVDRLEARDDGLYAIPKQVNAEFADLVKQGVYKKVSGSFYRPEAKNHPAPGNWYLRHVGFLGAAAPAIKGLRPIDFADAEDGFANFEEDTVELREYRLSRRERAWMTEENKRFVAQMSQKGTLPFGLRDEVEAFMETLSEDAVLNFADETGSDVQGSQLQWFKKYLSQLPTPVVTGELCKGEFSDEAEDFSAPENYKVNPELAKLHGVALAHQRKTGSSYADAVKAVIAQGVAD